MILQIEFKLIYIPYILSALLILYGGIGIIYKYLIKRPCEELEHLEFIAMHYNQKIIQATKEYSINPTKINDNKIKRLEKKKAYYLQNPCKFLSQFVTK